MLQFRLEKFLLLILLQYGKSIVLCYYMNLHSTKTCKLVNNIKQTRNCLIYSHHCTVYTRSIDLISNLLAYSLPTICYLEMKCSGVIKYSVTIGAVNKDVNFIEFLKFQDQFYNKRLSYTNAFFIAYSFLLCFFKAPLKFLKIFTFNSNS